MLQELDKDFEIFRVALPTGEVYVIAPTKLIFSLVKDGEREGVREQEIIEAFDEFEVPVVSKLGTILEYDWKKLVGFGISPDELIFLGISDDIVFPIHNETPSEILEKTIADDEKRQVIAQKLLEQAKEYSKVLCELLNDRAALHPEGEIREC